MDGATRLSGLHFNGAEIVLSLILALVLAWIVGVWLGERLARFVQSGNRPRRTVGGLMRVVLVAAIALALMAGDPAVLLYSIVLTPPIAVFQYLFRTH